MSIKDLLKKRILILDGAMGTMIQKYELTENDYRGNLYINAPGQLKGNNDLLSLTRPNVISGIHELYLSAGADIIETNTFNATSVSMADYHMQGEVGKINRAAAGLAKKAAEKYSTPDKPRFVAGSVGPTNKTCSMSPDVNNPAFRDLDFDELAASYHTQMTALIEEGVDLLLIETIFDTLNAKAALFAAEKAMETTGRTVPIMVSVTLSDSGGRTLSGQTLDAFLVSVQHAPILSIGLNCSFGARDMKPFLKQLSLTAPYYVSAHPNAGLPNRFGQYDETPESMASQVKEYIDEQLVNIIGGCCGTTPEHIAQYSRLIKNAAIRKPAPASKSLLLSGLEKVEIRQENNFVNIGERCNVAGSRLFLRLIKEKKYEEALQIARKQVEDGAQILDINMDDAMLDTKNEMVNFLNLIAAEPDICRVPIMIDSSKWEVIEAGLKCIQGKSIVNSISLKEGEELFLSHARTIKKLGAAIIVMAFDETGQADTFERKTEVCLRAYDLLVKEGINPNDIIFDPNVLAIATGIDEHLNYGMDFINATAWIKKNLPGARVSGGISNLSFSFRGNNYIREAIHSVFLYHAIAQGLDMGIVNPATSVTYSDIPPHILTVIEDVVLNRRADATEELISLAEQLKDGQTDKRTETTDERAGMTLDERLQFALLKGRSDTLESDLEEALATYGKAVNIIDGPLMAGMNKVGELFGAGKMFLPQVVKTARTMKQAVAILQPAIEAEKKDKTESSFNGKFLLATVKGDVHDIGKNIVSVVLSCNNYDVVDLGVMVPTEEIIKRAIREKVDFIGLSGLITPSLEEMCHVAEEMEKAGLTIPLMIGGATTSKLHTAVKIAPLYSGAVVHVKDAAQNPIVAARLMNQSTKNPYIKSLKEEQETLRQSVSETTRLLPFNTVQEQSLKTDWTGFTPYQPQSESITRVQFEIKSLRKLINWKFFFTTWRISGKYGTIAQVDGCDHCKAGWLSSFPEEERNKAAEAMQLYKEANRLLDKLEIDESIKIEARFGIFRANSLGNCIQFNVSPDKHYEIACLRQQIEKKDNDTYLSLSDFIAPLSSGKEDFAGVFAVTSGREIESKIESYNQTGDNYNAILLQSLADRLAEAAAEQLHYDVRTRYWGYAKDEKFDPQTLLKEKYQGIRPAIGYPSLPDQSLNFIIDEILNFDELGIYITENGAMQPNASISGLLISHPESKYFHIGKIDNDQRNDYCKKRNFTLKESGKWLSV